MIELHEPWFNTRGVDRKFMFLNCLVFFIVNIISAINNIRYCHKPGDTVGIMVTMR